ncbi:MAG: group II intron reverse transcriptase domain-containing protein [Lewinellaceae bacterium]|nr:group II intron reverse transcriptase domain-containing protein [Lewinellaceae bacterium]
MIAENQPLPGFDKKLLLDLFYAYEDARLNKQNTASALKFEEHYEENIFALWDEVREQRYQIGRSICFINFKPVKREIFAAHFRDRIVHHLIFNYLNPIVEPGFIKDSYSCRVGKGTHYGINRMQSFIRGCSHNYTRDAWILKMDILGYFMSIDRNILFDMICRKLERHNRPVDFDKSLLVYLLEKVIFNDPTTNCLIKGRASDWKDLPPSKSLFHAPPGKGFPIGNLTSQLFGNIYLNPFDHFVKEELGMRYYGRYVDDFVQVHESRDFLKAQIPKIRAFLGDELQLELHPRKIYLQHYTRGVQYLGAYLKPHRTYVSPRVKNNFYQAIQNWNRFIQENGNKIEGKALKKFIGSMNSYLGTLKHHDTYKLRKKLLRQLNGYFWNYVYISGGYGKLVAKRRRVKGLWPR